MIRKTIALAVLIVFSPILLSAQQGLERRPVEIAKPQPCPHPFSQTLTGGPTGASSYVAADYPANLQGSITGSTWNQTQTDKHFAYTFRLPNKGDCCIVTSATLRVTIKALNSGGVGASAANNDAVHLYSGGAHVAGSTQQPWVSTGVTAGTTATVTIQVPASVLATGQVSFYVQDDSAVVGATLTIEGCCLRKPK